MTYFYKGILVISYSFFILLISLFYGVQSVEAQSEVDPSCGSFTTAVVNCSDNSTSMVDPGPYGHFSNSAVGTTGTLTVSCDQRVINTSQKTIYYTTSCGTVEGACTSRVSNTGLEVACASYGSCGNGVKEQYECCDGGANCNGACQCVFSQSTQGGFCGDGICEGSETSSSCSADCSGSGACTIDETPNASPGATNVYVYQGESAFIGATVYDSGPASGSVQANYSFNGCPDGASCTGETGFAYAEDPDTQNIGMTVNTTASTPVGSYPILLHLYNPTKTACTDAIRYNLIVEPSRQTVCDGAWHRVSGNFVSSRTPVGKYFSTPATLNVFSPDAATGRSLYEQICTGATAGQTCSWNNSWSNWYTFPQTIDQAVYIPSVNYRTAVVSNTGGLMYTWAGVVWNIYPPPAPAWGTPNSAPAQFNRTYTFRRGSGNVVEYSCTVTQPNLTVDTMNTIGTLTAGTSIGFTGRVVNSGAATTGVSTQNRLRIDIGNNGTWDVTVSPNQSTGVLAASANETETWSNAWVATAGTHKFEICADATNLVVESDENNCYNSGTFVVSAAPTATADITANPGSITTGGSSNISWTSSNATSCSVSCLPGTCSGASWTGTSKVNQSTGALSATRTYTLSCLPAGPASNDSVTVTVGPASYRLNVNKSGQGTVTSTVGTPAINCGSICQADYTPNDPVTLQAVPSTGRIFTGWSGSCSGRGVCSLIMDTDKSVTANFAVDPNYKEF